jgi:magnesium-transporting ATPase (P-type)
LDTPSHGLSQPEAARRLEQYGYNELAEKRTILC